MQSNKNVNMRIKPYKAKIFPFLIDATSTAGGLAGQEQFVYFSAILIKFSYSFLLRLC
jgi:hypothetical protein